MGKSHVQDVPFAPIQLQRVDFFWFLVVIHFKSARRGGTFLVVRAMGWKMHIEELSANAPTWTPISEGDCVAVRSHLEQILASRLFANSKRYPNFLRYVVAETLARRGDQLKERSLGIEVFARKPDYDTNLDHIVRSTATEVRRRLNLFYQEDGTASDIRIELPQRSYVPVFHRGPLGGSESLELGRRGFHPSVNRNNRWIAYAALAGIGLLVGAVGARLLGTAAVRASVRTPNQQEESLIALLTPSPGQQLNAVTNDARLLALNTEPGTFVSLQAYESNRLPKPGADFRGADLLTIQGITRSEVQLAERIFESTYPLQVSLKSPSQVNADTFQRDNALLVGGPRANPWAQLFEDSLNFKTELPTGERIALIRNASPQSGEQEYYSDAKAADGAPGHFYGRIAYFPASSNHGRILLVSGPHSVGTFGALAFVTDPVELKEVLRLFHKETIGDLPRFELLIELTSTSGAITKTEVVSSRLEENL